MRGADWPARSSGGHPLLLLSGTLRNSLHVSAGGDSVKVGSPTIYAAIHQLGGVIVPKSAKRLVFSAGGKKVFAKKVTIPARPFLPFDKSGKLIGVAEQEVDEAIDGLVSAASGS
jgi:phage gpG-like protein